MEASVTINSGVVMRNPLQVAGGFCICPHRLVRLHQLFHGIAITALAIGFLAMYTVTRQVSLVGTLSLY